MTGTGVHNGMRQVHPPAPAPSRSGRNTRGVPASSGRLGWIVALSLATGFVAALLLAALPFVPVKESAITGAVLCGFASGWALLWLLSLRFTDQPQRWAVVPALFMGVGGLLLVAFGSPAREALSWVWPPTLFVLVIWMLHQTRRDMRSRSGRVQLYLVFAILALSAVGGAYQTVGEATDSTAMPATGRLIDVGGHKLYLNCVGSGSPTVVLEPGAGATSSQLGWITPAVARSTRVCVYDRAGRGWSEPADSPQDGAQIATDLHTLLHRGGVTGPYVLAGHSFGGLYVRIFAAHYPDEVAGLVLVDSTASKEPARSVIPSSGDDSSDDPVGRIPSPGVALGSRRPHPLARTAGPRDASAALPRRGTGQRCAGELGPQYCRRVHAGQRLDAGSCLTSRLRRQTSLRPDSRRTPGFLDGVAGQDADAVDEQRAADRRRRHPHRRGPRGEVRRRYCPGHPCRRGLGAERPTREPVTSSSPDKTLPRARITKQWFTWTDALGAARRVCPVVSARRVCPSCLPGVSARRVCPACLPGVSARRVCPSCLPVVSARRVCPRVCPALWPVLAGGFKSIRPPDWRFRRSSGAGFGSGAGFEPATSGTSSAAEQLLRSRALEATHSLGDVRDSPNFQSLRVPGWHGLDRPESWHTKWTPVESVRRQVSGG